MKRFLYTWALGLASGLSAQAQWQTLNTSNSPLHSNVVREVSLDTDGSKWIATQSAVQKLAGSTWTTYTATADFPYTAIRCIAARNQVVWVGTDKGLSRFDGTRWTTFNDPALLPVGLYGPNDLAINDVVVAQNGTVWLAGSRGIARFDGQTWTRFNSSNSSLREEAVTALELDEAVNTLWVATNCNSANSGVYALHYPNYSWSYNRLGGQNCVHGLTVGSTGTVFLGTCNTSGVQALEGGVLSPALPTSCVALDGVAADPSHPGRAWVATESIGAGGSAPKGLLVYDGSRIVQEFNAGNSGLPSNLLSSVVLEQSGSQLKAWVGTADQGLAVYETTVTAQRAARPSLAPDVFPNPARTQLEVRAPLTDGELILYDNRGRLLHRQAVSQAGPIWLDMRQWPAGLYHLRLTGGQGSGYARFSKE